MYAEHFSSVNPNEKKIKIVQSLNHFPLTIVCKLFWNKSRSLARVNLRACIGPAEACCFTPAATWPTVPRSGILSEVFSLNVASPEADAMLGQLLGQPHGAAHRTHSEQRPRPAAGPKMAPGRARAGAGAAREELRGPPRSLGDGDADPGHHGGGGGGGGGGRQPARAGSTPPPRTFPVAFPQPAGQGARRWGGAAPALSLAVPPRLASPRSRFLLCSWLF